MKNETANALRAMDYLVRCMNDEEYIDIWLMCGIADGDCDSMSDDELVDMYSDDLEELISMFLRLMQRAGKGGLCINGVVVTTEIKD